MSVFDSVGYAGMSLITLVSWIGISTLVGFLARLIVRGTALFGLYGDLLVGLIAIFGLGAGLRALNVDISQHVMLAAPNIPSPLAVWLDVALVGLVGSLLLRGVAKVLTRR